MSKPLDLVGERYGKLVVLERDLNPIKDAHITWWKVKCDCGTIKSVRGNSMRQGESKSCGKCCSRKSTVLGESAKWSYYTLQRINASRRKISFTLSLEEFLRITGSSCHYCGRQWSSEYPNPKYTLNSTKPELVGRFKLNGTYKHNGIDRVDSNIGYVSDNCVPCCADCNFSKQRMTQEQFREWIVRVHSHYIKSSQLAKEMVEA